MNKSFSSLYKGLFWSAIDKFAVVVFQLFFDVVLAKLLTPADYGVIGMVAVFLAISQVFVDSGFMNALIQKQDRTEVDYSTVFYFSTFISVVIYLLLFFLAPFIADFYRVDVLTSVIRVLCLSILFNSLGLIYRTKLSISLDFKSQAKLSILSVIISGIIGVFLAYENWGVWALVIQSICLSGLNTFFLIYNQRWRPLFVFSKKSFNQLFSFGSKLLLAGLIQNIYNNLYSVLIGKFFKPADMGVYAKSNQFTLYPSGIITNVLQRVMYPFFVKFQNDNNELVKLNAKYNVVVSLIFFPLFVGLSVLAEPFVRVVLSDNWLDTIPVLRVLSLAFLTYPFININMFMFQIKGVTKKFLELEIITKISGVLILLLTLKFGILIMCVGLLIQNIFQLLITSYHSDKIISNRSFSQVVSLMPILIYSIIVYFIVFVLLYYMKNIYYQFCVGGLIIIVLYALFYLTYMRQFIFDIYLKFKTNSLDI